jgi:protein SCO1/2
MPQIPFVRRYVLAMSVLILAAVLATLALRESVRARTAAGPAAPAVLEAAAPGALPELGEVGEFSLTDQSGAAFTAASLRGKIYVVDFFFTSCGSVCPLMSEAMSKLHKKFAAEPQVAFLSISVDPVTDTPEVLAKYAARYAADPARWHFLTGADAAIQLLAKDRFKLGHADEPVNHTTRFVLVDRAGKIRGYYFGTEPASVSELGQAIQRLLVPGDSGA